MNTPLKPFGPGSGQASTPVAQTLAQLWQEVLQTPELPKPTDNFFDLGGDSMTMTMLEYRIREELAVELPAGVLLNTQTLLALSALIESLSTDSSSPQRSIAASAG